MNTNGGNVIYHFKGDTSDLADKLKSLDKSITKESSSMKGMTKSFVVATGVTKALSAGINLIKGSMDSAISRFDTMNNFSKVMSNLGISTEDSEKAIKTLSDKLQGLPTTLNEGALAIQRFASANGDIKKSTDIFLSLNNALLAGGASADIQSTALEQISQAYAKGKPDMMEWRSMMTAMPAQLKQVATAMGYVSSADLGEAIREDGGEEEFQRFIETLILLNKKGIGEFQSFEEQAKNATGGIGTAISVAKSRVVQGVEAMLQGINKGLANANLPSIAEIIVNTGTIIKSALKNLAPAIAGIIKKISNFYNWIKENKTVVTLLVVALGSMYTAFKLLTIISTITNTIKAFQLGIVVLKTTAALCGGSISTLRAAMLMLNLTFLTSPIFWIITGIVALVAAFVILWNKCEWFRNFFITMWEGIKATLNAFVEWIPTIPERIITIFNGIKEFISNIPYYIGYLLGWLSGKLLIFTTQTIPNFINNVVTWFQELPGKIWNSLVTTFTNIGIWITNMYNKVKEGIPKVVNAIINFFKKLPQNMSEIGKNIVKGLWEGIKNAKNWMANKVNDFAKGILDGMRRALGIHSPSTEFALLGKFSVLGYTEQLDKMKGQLQDAVENTFALSPELIGSSSLHYSPNVIVNNNISSKTDPLGQVVTNIKTFANGAKNDYNYGMGV